MNIIKTTEKSNPSSENIDSQSTLEILKTINEQDITVPLTIKSSLKAINNFIDELILRINKNGRLFYVGSGTSGRLGILDAVECPPTYRTDPGMIQGIIAGGHNALFKSVEGAEDCKQDGAKSIINASITKYDTVLGISASGSTPFVLGALREASNKSALTGLLVCNEISELNYVDHVISVVVGPEVITGSTRMKAGTATKLILNMISTTLMIKLNKTYNNLMVDVNVSNTKLLDRGVRIISELTSLNYNRSKELLLSAKGDVKVAIIIFYRNCDYDDAINILEINSGNLKKAIKNN